MVKYFFFFQAEDGIRDYKVTGVQTCALPIYVIRNRPAAQADDAAQLGARARGDRDRDERAAVLEFRAAAAGRREAVGHVHGARPARAEHAGRRAKAPRHLRQGRPRRDLIALPFFLSRAAAGWAASEIADKIRIGWGPAGGPTP